MNNEVLPTTYLGRELPKEYVNSIEKGETFPEWLTMFPHTEYEYSTEIEVWSKEDLLSHTYSESFCNYAFFACDDVAFSVLQTRDEDTLTPEELQSAFAIGSVNEGFVFINLHDGSLWIWYSDTFCEKVAENFSDFQNLLTEEPVDGDEEDIDEEE